MQFYIDISKPKAIITLIDNDESFYELNLNSNCKRILIQNTFRSTQGDIFSKIEYLKKKTTDVIISLFLINLLVNYIKNF